jgi:hypothetical protein
MVQVDVFWSYAFGAGFAFAASRQIETARAAAKPSLIENRYFTAALLYIGVLFAPSGISLLWAFPSWETMHVGDRDLPTWLVTLFAVTNVTQCVLGFWIVTRLVAAGRRYLAFLQMPLGYLGMFFILVHGWDGTGYRRFFSATAADFAEWRFTQVFAWLVSDVALTLYLMGVFLVPPLLYLLGNWTLAGYSLGDADRERAATTTRMRVAMLYVRTIFVGGLLPAIVASLLIHLLGWLLGAAAFALIAYAFLYRKGAWLYRLADAILLPQGGVV